MGNATSSAEDGDQDMQGMIQLDDSTAAEENLRDFSCLFQPESLYKALLAVKEPPGSAINRNKEGMVKWLKGLADRDEQTVNIVQVVEHLTSKGVSKEEALEFFSEVDKEGEGQVDITYLLMVLKDSAVDPMQALLPCYTLPGPLDVYLPDKNSHCETGKKLIHFLQSRRVEPSCLMVSCMEQVLGLLQQREKLVLGRHQMLLQKEKDNEMSGEGETEETENVIITKCYSKIISSTGMRTINNLTDNRPDTYWQSNGSPRSHWVRVHMLPGVKVKELAIGVSSNDDSYMPKSIVVSAGNTESHLTEIKNVAVPRDKNGRFVLLCNLGSHYRYIQVNIRSCHSDGCDVRLHGLYMKGCKVSKEPEPTVMDTMAIWYISLLASTAQAAMPVAPQLRDTILAQSRTALRALPPLVLSPSSGTRPDFLTPFVVKEMEKMLQSLSLPEETFVSVSAKSYQVLLAFSLAHGNVNSILDCLQILLDNQSLDLEVRSLLQEMEEVKTEKHRKHAEELKLSLVSCDGGQKDDAHRPDNILTNDISNNAATPYMSAQSHPAVSMVVQEEEHHMMKITRLLVHVPSGESAATSGLAFLVDGPVEKEWLEGLSSYDGWGRHEYNKWRQETKGKEDGSGPVAFFEFSKDTRQVEVVVDVKRTGKFLVLRLCASGEEVESVSVQVLKVYGYKVREEEVQISSLLNRLDTIAPIPAEGESVVGAVVLCRVLSFLAFLLHDLSVVMSRRRRASLDPSLITEPHLSVDSLSLKKVWDLYIPLTLTQDGQSDYAALLTLLLLRSALPFIKQDKRPKQAQGNDSLAVSPAVLNHLCGLLDSAQGAEPTVQQLAQDIVVEGVVVFFPDATARKEYVLSMIGSVLSDNQPRSWWLKFEALCQYFSKADVNSLLNLPSKVEEGQEIEIQGAMGLLSTMLTVASREAQMCLQSGKPRPGDLVQLLCALQCSLFFWCKKNIAVGGPRGVAQTLLLEYVEKLVTHSTTILREIGKMAEVKEETLKALQKSLLTRTLAEMLVFLTTIAESPMPKTKLMDRLYPLVPSLQAVAARVPGASLRLDAETLKDSGEKDAVVGVWIRESPHNYENNSRITEEFVCPSATKFVVEFDSRCVTERRYDYLEFTDGSGTKTKFDDSVGSSRWPQTAEFSGPKLHFYFHSDGSNNDWGYKFTLRAFGRSVPSYNWLFDLQLSTARLLGLLCSTTLSTKTIHQQLPDKKTEEWKEEELLTRSDLWKTLFRGGYMVGKLTRSLSGAYAASPADSALSSMLQDMANGPEGIGARLLASLREKGKGPYYGGVLVDKAVNSVFAALIWHCQDLRDELAPQLALSEVFHPSPLLREAFTTAEALRRELVEARQKLVEAKEKEEVEEKRAQIDEDAPVNACHQKAVFLLKFAGLSRVTREEEELEEVDGSSAPHPTWPRRSSQHWQKLSNAISTVGKLKQQLSLGGQVKPRKKPLSFDLVLSFVKNDGVTVDRVHRLLQERERLASSVAQVYNYIFTYLSAITVDSMFELPGLVFLQQILAKQRHFPTHYAAKLDGCGLELENQVRKSYRLLLQKLLDSLSAFSKPPSKEYFMARLLVGILTCHLLDNEWQDYDHHLLSELQLSDFLLQSAIRSTNNEEKERVEKFEGEEAMLERYTVHMALQEKLHELGGRGVLEEAFENLDLVKDNKWESELYMVAAAATSLVVEVQCDGCQTIIRNGNRFYHNMDLKSQGFDLCPTCFKNGTGSRPDDHTSDQLYQCIGGYVCKGCKMNILTHRFHSNATENYDLCLGCFRKEEAKGSSEDWSVYLLKEQPSSGPANRFLSSDPEHSQPLYYQGGFLTRVGPALDLMVYNQQHCWILFTALCLSMSHTLNYKHSSTHEQSYKVQACRILKQCLGQLVYVLHAAIMSKWEELARKKAEEARELEKKKEEEARERIRKEKEEKKEPEGEEQLEKEEENVGQQEGGEEGTAPEGNKSEDISPALKQSEENGREQVLQPQEPTTADQEPTTADQEPTTADQEPTTADQEPTTADQEPTTADQEPTTAVQPRPQDIADTKHPSSETTPMTTPAGEEPENAIVTASRKRWQEDREVTMMEKTFGALATERCLGLLAAVLPHDMTLQGWVDQNQDMQRFLAGQLLPVLLQMAACPAVTEQLRCLAHLVAVQYMARVNPEVADRSIQIARGQSPDQSMEPGQKESGPGLLTTKYFFTLGATFLRKSDFAGAATIVRCLLLLSTSLPWKAALSHTIVSSLHTKPEDMDISSIFALMLMAGFPKLHREGSIVMLHSGEASPQQAVLTSVTEDSGAVVSPDTRQPKPVKLSQCEVVDTLRGCINFSQLRSLLPLLQRSLQLARQENERQVEATWILALSLKALLVLLEGSESGGAVKSVLQANLLPGVVKLACRATRFSQKWLASDLEVVAIQSYQPVLLGQEAERAKEKEGEKGKEKGKEEKEKEGEEKEEKEEEEEEEEGEEGKKKEEDSPTHQAEEACLQGLSDEIRDMLVIMQEAFQCSLPVLRALFEASGSDVNQFIMSSEQYYDMERATLQPPDEIIEAAKKWEPGQMSVQDEVQDIQDSLEDMGVTRLVPIKLNPKTLEAESEGPTLLKKPKTSDLMGGEDEELAVEDKVEHSREESFQLLQEKLKEGQASREQLLKTQQALVVLHARQVLASVLGHWPRPPHSRISTTALGNIDVMQLFCLLDLLMKPLKQDARKALLGSVLQCTEVTEVVSLAVTAAQCMRQVRVGLEKKELSHPGTNTTTEKGKIVIPNASSMTVVFHQINGEVELSSKEDFTDHHKILAATETDTQKELTHVIPGNAVHYRVTLNSVKVPKHPPCTITATGTQMGRFSSGLCILQQLLEEGTEIAHQLPLSQLWPNLIAVACQHTGKERLKVISLLLQILNLVKQSSVHTRPDLSALKPLWQLYTTLMKDYEGKTKSQQLLAPEIVRALTELFLVVENQAEVWGVSQDMVIETLTKEGLHTWLEKGISNVAFLSLSLGLDNTASRAFIEAKKSYVPPKKKEEEEEEEDEEVDGSSSEEEDIASEPSDLLDSFDSYDS